jgi:hypothetical protein
MSRNIVRDGTRHSLVFSRGSHLDVPPALHASPVTLTAAVVPASSTPTTMTMEQRLQLLLLLALVVLALVAHVVTTTSTRALLISRTS